MKTIGAILLLALAVVIYGQLNMRSVRFAGIIEARHFLKVAQDDFKRTGSVTNHNENYKVWLATNVVAVAGTEHRCQFMIQVPKFYSEGSLAMSTNGTLIWLGEGQSPKLITSDYRPRLFPPGF